MVDSTSFRAASDAADGLGGMLWLCIAHAYDCKLIDTMSCTSCT